MQAKWIFVSSVWLKNVSTSNLKWIEVEKSSEKCYNAHEVAVCNTDPIYSDFEWVRIDQALTSMRTSLTMKK